MRKLATRLLIFLVIFIAGTSVVEAAGLESASIRLERTSSGSSPLPILVMVKTGNSQIENGFKIRLGSKWSVVDEVTVSTANLPANVSIWPGIRINSTTSDSMIFSGGNLSVDKVYGFYITSGVGNNPEIGDGSGYVWEVATLDGEDVLSEAKLKVPIVEDNQVTVTGKVGARANDFQIQTVSNKSDKLSYGEEIKYDITYGSYLATETRPLVISAEWSRGTLAGSPVPSLEVVDYVIGSGTTAWGGVQPVIDPVHRTITWTINSFPATTVNQQVSFSLRVTSKYSGNSEVAFRVTTTLDGAKVVTISSSTDNIYHPDWVEPTAAPTTISQSDGNNQKKVPTVAPVWQPVKIEKIEIVNLSEKGIEIAADSSDQPLEVRIKYGVGLNKLNDSITSINKTVKDVIKIEDLEPATTYYFRVEVVDESGKTTSSELYTFTTAATASQLLVDKKSLLVSSADNIVLDAKANTDQDNLVVLTTDQTYSMRLNVANFEKVKTMKVVVRNAKVLGISSVFGAEPSSTEADLVNVGSGGFTAHLVSPKEPGYYEVVVRVEDVEGNILEEKIGEVRVVPPLTVVDDKGIPIENAKLELYWFNPDLRVYELATHEMFGIQNPVYTGDDGRVVMNIPAGNYRVKVSVLGYADQEQKFLVGYGESEGFPKIVMKRTSIGLFGLISYFGGTWKDTYSFTVKFLEELVRSRRFLHLMTAVSGLTSVILGWKLASKKLKVYWWQLPKKIIWELRFRHSYKDNGSVMGIMSDSESGMPISGVKVYLADNKFNRIVSKDITDDLGIFHLRTRKLSAYRLAAVRNGYEPSPMWDFTAEGIKAARLHLAMTRLLTEMRITEDRVTRTLTIAGNGLLTLFVSLTMVLGLTFWRNFGVRAAIIIVLMSWLNMAIWLVLIIKKNEN